MALTIRGRFAPSPTGRLHLGHVSAALLSWLHCRLQNGDYLLRIDDLDVGRCKPEYTDQILRDLEWLGLDWDEQPYYQSQRLKLYESHFYQLKEQGLLYPCFCSRKEINLAAIAPEPGLAPIYPGTCRTLSKKDIALRDQEKNPAWRIHCQGQVNFQDHFQGLQHFDLVDCCGDFVIKRNDQAFAYHLACVSDDMDMQINLVSRGLDLLPSTAPQLYLYQLFNNKPPQFAHLPLVLDDQGQKLSKSKGSIDLAWYRSHIPSSLLIGQLAQEKGLIDEIEALSPQELLAQVSLEKLYQATSP